VLREYTMYPGIDAPHSLRAWSGTTPGSPSYYVLEQPGHVAGLASASNTVANQYKYTPWGQPESTSETIAQPLRFMAREYDATTGLYYVRARWYDPALARFNSEDPVGLDNGMNSYAYGLNDPLETTDPTGEWCEVRGRGTPDEKLHCEDISPSDFCVIRYYVGGAKGQNYFDLFNNLGWARLDAASCRGGFSYRQCTLLAESFGYLISHGDATCSLAGSVAEWKFQRGLLQYQPDVPYSGRAEKFFRTSGRIFLSQSPFAEALRSRYLVSLAEIVAHEGIHFVYPLAGSWFNHDNGTDWVYRMGRDCA